MLRFIALGCVCASLALAGCGPSKPVVTNGAGGTDINNDRRSDLLAVSRTNGAAAMPHGLLLFPERISASTPRA